ncbi:methylated-DNA--[protein]-cysteine S-methyltransferase [Aquabacterium humicola]|uniref:methylated-DNA--[protein]-cysteine S-methyltransferase n=1 Tax=Aquabacterium humicola TaxID=3237377 RepID=UPI002542DDB4|nr:methylated-DNA--[protein]-cysteine S-methyltransferase [Rubrivivax pictus]
MNIPAGGWALFDTAIGWCGIAWGDAGLRGAQLPQADEAATRARMQRRFPRLPECEPPPEWRALVADLQALLRGEPRDLSGTRLDWRGVTEFHQRVYRAALAIPPGCTLTYGDIAQQIGEPGGARAVGQALGANPFAPVVPCHRVLAAGGHHGGFSAHGGAATKLKMLQIEGARPPDDQPTLF